MTDELVAYRAPITDAAGAVVRWAEAADAAYQLAQKLCVSSFVPAQFRNKPAEAAVAIIAGAEIDLPPLKALNGFDVINGIAAPRALTLRAIALAQGHEILVDAAAPDRVVMRGRRRGTTDWQSVEWTIKRATQLGLTTRTRDADKNPWLRQPQNMLVARATAELVRLIAADAVLGIAYAAEELDDDRTSTMTVARSTNRTKVKRATPPALEEPEVPAPEPEPKQPLMEVEDIERPQPQQPEPPLENQPVDSGEPMITRPQIAKIAVGLKDLGITERDGALAYVARAIGHSITSRNELTLEEASTVIDSIEFDLHAADEDEDKPEEDT